MSWKNMKERVPRSEEMDPGLKGVYFLMSSAKAALPVPTPFPVMLSLHAQADLNDLQSIHVPAALHDVN